MNYLKYIGFIVGGIISLASAIVIFSCNYSDVIKWSLMLGLFLMATFAIIIPVALYLDYRKMQHHPDNQIYQKI